MGIGINLKRILEERGMTMKQLSDISTVSYSTIAKIIREDSYSRKSTVERLAKALGLTVKSLTSETFENSMVENIDEISFNQDLRDKIVFLVDFENIRHPNYDFLYVENSVSYCFFNSNIYSTKFFNLMRLPNVKTTMIPIYTTKARDQYIDHLILFYVGVITTKFKDTQVYVISGDSGYRAPIEYIIENFKSNVIFLKITKYRPLSYFIKDGTIIFEESIIEDETEPIKNTYNKPIEDSEDEVAATKVEYRTYTKYPYKEQKESYIDKLNKVSLAFCSHIKRSLIFVPGVDYTKKDIYTKMNKFMKGNTSLKEKSLFNFMVSKDILLYSKRGRFMFDFDRINVLTSQENKD